MNRLALASSVVCALLLAGCVALPVAPTVMALPGSTKGLDQFRVDDDYCRAYAQARIGGSAQVASGNAAASAAAGTAIGAAAGAIIGSASGNAGPGAAIGAGTGLLFGSAYGTDMYGYSYYALQQQYDAAYVQCMYARGNRVPVRGAYGGTTQGRLPQDYSAPYPSRSGSPASGYVVPDPRTDSIPPPDTPPPRQ
ncbi:MAG TPA: glycine zipper family protein [Casimicrobiaceae bacterium]|nr:glycine zipper family protein [Casimicrobiaceae bacterium]